MKNTFTGKAVALIAVVGLFAVVNGSLTQATPITYDTCLQDDSSGYLSEASRLPHGDHKLAALARHSPSKR